MTPQAAIDDAVTRSAGIVPGLIAFMRAEAEAFVARVFATTANEQVKTEFLHKINVTKIGTVSLSWQLFPGWPWNYLQLLAQWNGGNPTLTADFLDWQQGAAFPPPGYTTVLNKSYQKATATPA